MATTKQRYAYLDGIRGIAAMFVVLRHTVDLWTFDAYRSYLAVDIFFVLSGFVIANAYARRMESGELSVRGFALVRLIRLYPVYLISLCFAIPIYLYEQTMHGSPLPSSDAVSLVLLSLFFLPGLMIPNGLLFPINPPYWSLFFELIANFIYAITRPFLSTKVLVYLVVALGVVVLGAGEVNHNLDYGFLFGTKSFIAGLVRAAFGIFFGVLIHSQLGRFNIRPKPWLAIAVICVVFMIPSIGRYDFIVDMIAVCLVFPACVVLAAVKTEDRYSKVMLFLGSASYPLYLLHEPIGQWVMVLTHGYAKTLAPYSGWALLLALVPLCALLDSRLDAPLRKWLSRRLMPRKPSAQLDTGNSPETAVTEPPNGQEPAGRYEAQYQNAE